MPDLSRVGPGNGYAERTDRPDERGPRREARLGSGPTSPGPLPWLSCLRTGVSERRAVSGLAQPFSRAGPIEISSFIRRKVAPFFSLTDDPIPRALSAGGNERTAR